MTERTVHFHFPSNQVSNQVFHFCHFQVSCDWCETISAVCIVEANKKAPVKTRLVNQFLLSIYVRNGGMLPDKYLGHISLGKSIHLAPPTC